MAVAVAVALRFIPLMDSTTIGAALVAQVDLHQDSEDQVLVISAVAMVTTAAMAMAMDMAMAMGMDIKVDSTLLLEVRSSKFLSHFELFSILFCSHDFYSKVTIRCRNRGGRMVRATRRLRIAYISSVGTLFGHVSNSR